MVQPLFLKFSSQGILSWRSLYRVKDEEGVKLFHIPFAHSLVEKLYWVNFVIPLLLTKHWLRVSKQNYFQIHFWIYNAKARNQLVMIQFPSIKRSTTFVFGLFVACFGMFKIPLIGSPGQFSFQYYMWTSVPIFNLVFVTIFLIMCPHAHPNWGFGMILSQVIPLNVSVLTNLRGGYIFLS